MKVTVTHSHVGLVVFASCSSQTLSENISEHLTVSDASCSTLFSSLKFLEWNTGGFYSWNSKNWGKSSKKVWCPLVWISSWEVKDKPHQKVTEELPASPENGFPKLWPGREHNPAVCPSVRLSICPSVRQGRPIPCRSTGRLDLVRHQHYECSLTSNSASSEIFHFCFF